MIRSIIFDIYGTLIDIKSDETIKNSVWTDLLKPYQLSGKLPTPIELREFYLESCSIEMKKYKTKYPDIEIREIFKKIVHKFLDKKHHNDSYFVDELTWEFRKASTIELTLREGATELLETLKEKEYLLGIISNTQDGFTWGELENFKIAHFFETIVYSSVFNIKKPDIDLFFNGLKLLNTLPEESIYIGNDPIDDVQGGKEAGLKVIYLGHWNDKKDLKYKPDYFIKSKKLSEVAKIIEKMEKNEF